MADDPQAQHYLECTQCNRNAQYYCNTCADRLCEKCQKNHSTDNASSHHDVVLYQEKQTSRPKAQLCQIHSALSYTMCCRQFEVPVCQKCIKDQHKKHSFVDIDVIFETNNEEYKDQIFKITNEFLPRSTALLEDVREDNAKTKEEFVKMRSSMTSKAQVLKDFIDAILFENTQFLQYIENSLISELQQQEKIMNMHIAYLHNAFDEYEKYAQTNNRAGIILSRQKNPISKMANIPKLNRLTLPSFVDIKASKEDIFKVFGKVQEPKGRKEVRKVGNNVQVWTKSGESMKMIPSATKMTSFTTPGVERGLHISPVTAEEAWISDDSCNLKLTDMKGKRSKVLKYSRNSNGCHTTSQSGDLIFLKDSNVTICKILSDKKKPVSIIEIQSGFIASMFSSSKTGDILVGIGYGDDARVIRYTKTGEEVHQIQYGDIGQPLYDDPHYITENHINHDVCVSDYKKRAVVVVDRYRYHRFSYTGHPPGSEFWPFGISTDTQGHILVSDVKSNTVQMTDKDGNFLSFLLTIEQGIWNPAGLSLDVRNNLLWVGKKSDNSVSIYRYHPCNNM